MRKWDGGGLMGGHAPPVGATPPCLPARRPGPCLAARPALALGHPAAAPLPSSHRTWPGHPSH